ncbi:glycoside hydrolase family 3 C-terminal domain-containing protein [soil metagenome]
MSSRVESLLADLTVDEKASLTSGVDMWHGHAVERLGIPALKVSDGPVGVRGDRWVGTTSACAPCGTALGATWNPELVSEVGRVLGEEARSKSVDILLAPTVNLHRNPLAGRNFECYSEDPFLTARAAVAFIDGVQSTGVGACIKHFVANDSEYQRHTISSQVGERVLRELYLVPFETVMAETEVISVMSAYNRLNGTYCAEHHWLLEEVLKGEWKFDGLVMSDWWGTMSPESAGGGLDLEMPGPAKQLGPTVAERIRAGELDEAVLDEMVRRLLSVTERLGLLDADPRGPERSEDLPEHREILRRAAQESVVLLRNDAVDGAPVLPLDVASLTSVAVIGPNSNVDSALGGGSAAVNPHHVVTVLDGLRAALPDSVRITHEVGVNAFRTAPPIDPRRLRPTDATPATNGLTVEYFANRDFAGEPTVVEHAASPRLTWMGAYAAPGVPTDNFSVRLRGLFVADTTGEHTFSLVTGGTGGRVTLGDDVILDNYAGQEPCTAFFGLGSAEIRATVPLQAGETREIVGEFTGYEGLQVAAFLIGHLPPIPEDGIAAAARAAADADVAIVVVGLNQDSETEGEDRVSMSLPGDQDDLLRAVIAANPRTVVLVNAGSVVDLTAAEGAAALAQTWYLGQETGTAVADLLLGDANPSGRLPTTYGRREQDWSSYLNYPGEAGQVLYGEELYMGYRGFDRSQIEPLFPFGHGLSYTTFAWGDASLSTGELALADLSSDAALTVSIDVTNTGDRAGAEVVQCYVHDVDSTLRRPDQELRGFAKVQLEAGQTATVQIPLTFRSFAAWNPETSEWTVEPGEFEIRVGASSRDRRDTVSVKVTD